MINNIFKSAPLVVKNLLFLYMKHIRTFIINLSNNDNHEVNDHSDAIK